jgi:hypothetical protein
MISLDKLNEATLTIKYGYDEGDGPDNKKLVKYLNKKSGATIKLGKNETLIITGTDEQIHKALQLHYSDDKKGLGDLEYHKKGKTSSPDHQKGQFTYKEGVEHIDEGSRPMKSFFELSKQLAEAKDEFKPHKMYDPKTGEAHDADTEADHLKYKKMGYTHEKPEVKEGFSPKEIKMAIGIASDPRYKGGNMTGAVRAIDKIKKGLSGHKQVMAVLKRQNEDIEEAMSPKEKAAHAKAIADFKKRGGKVKKLKPGYAQGWTGKDDLGTGQKGMLNKSDTSKFGTKKKMRSMRAHVESTNLDEKVYSKPAKLDPAIAKDPKVKAAQKAHAKGDWDGNVDKEGNAVVHVKGKPHTVTIQMESMNEATNMYTDDRVGFQIDRFSMGKDKGVGFQINYGKGIGKGKYIQVPMDDMKRVIAQMTKAMKAKI